MPTKHNLKYHGGKTRDRIVDYLARNPGATAPRIARALGLDPSAASVALGSMHKVGITTRRIAGRAYAYMLRDGKQVEQANSGELAALQARLAELEAFKAEAVSKHPDLIPIDYEAYRAALAAFYTVGGWKSVGEDIANGANLSAAERQRIDGLIAAAALMPKGA